MYILCTIHDGVSRLTHRACYFSVTQFNSLAIYGHLVLLVCNTRSVWRLSCTQDPGSVPPFSQTLSLLINYS